MKRPVFDLTKKPMLTIPMKIKIFILAGTFLNVLHAQSPETPIYDQDGAAIKQTNQEIIEKALLIREELKALPKDQIDLQMLEPVPAPFETLPPRTTPMSVEDIADHARTANLRVGYCYKCLRCDDWHLSLAGGYAIAEDIVVTCDHVLATKTKMREGFLVVVDHKGAIACGTAILARSASMDAAIIKVAGAKFMPVPLNSNVRQGSASYCFSQPLGQVGYFSSGIVNRFLWQADYSGQDSESLDALLHLRVNLSTDWAPGSSGSPLFDQSGNVIGHVSTIAALGSGKSAPPQLMIHTAVPGKSVQKLSQTMDQPAELKRIANIFPKAESKPAQESRKEPE